MQSILEESEQIEDFFICRIWSTNHPSLVFKNINLCKMPAKVFKSATSAKFKPVYKKPNTPTQTWSVLMRIYRKTISNLKIREELLRSIPSEYDVGPTLIWTEDACDLSIFTTAESYEHFIGFEAPFSNPKSPKFLKKILGKMRMTKGSILIKESTPTNAMHIPVHFCAYRIDEAGELTIFDPSWHSADPGIYSTTAFYDSLDAFGITYKHAEPKRGHHWQSVLQNDVFCQTWSLRWLLSDSRAFPLPKTRLEAAKQIAIYAKEFVRMLTANLDTFIHHLPIYKLEGHDAKSVFCAIVSCHQLVKIIYDLFG